ncbi:helix-hairpin-helix domain-containing protein [Carboxylicivirga sp. N1Y90]|uniref:helix-hairpin-helix domain-containing protein n=1 Tax=Carboxylicivirga fragile TaxID=3417571 RepID=UPI003D33DC67|nr:helix-hairpin-helix domain-containing protein [Marinilabiliaceae bacterium N1Y90]
MGLRQDYFTLSRREQVGFLSLIVILFCLIVVFFLRSDEAEIIQDPELDAWVSEVNELNRTIAVESSRIEFFAFNPNKASAKQLKQLGFSEYAIANLVKYRDAGGKISSFSKFKGIYGVDSSHLRRIQSYIVFDKVEVDQQEDYKKSYADFYIDLNSVDSAKLIKWSIHPLLVNDILSSRQNNYFTQRYSRDSLMGYSLATWHEIKAGSIVSKRVDSLNDEFVIELNEADTAALVVLRGIGSVLARRIVYYRNRLGGFYDVKQLLEVEGVSPVVLSDNQEHLKVDPDQIKPVNINKASLKSMKNHPYIDFYMAKDIYELRKKDGVINTFHSVFNLASFANKDTSLIKRYVYFED